MADSTRPFHWGRPNPNYTGPEKAAEGNSAGGSAATASGDFASEEKQPPVAEAMFETTPLVDEEDEDGEPLSEYEIGSMMEMEIDFARDQVIDVVSEWADGDHATDKVCIFGEGMGWTRSSGHKVIDTEDLVADPIQAIAPRTSELTQKWELNHDGTLVAHQGHHDSPMMGEKYTFRFMDDDEVEAYEYGEWNPEDHREVGS